MSGEKRTRIDLPHNKLGQFPGISAWGELTREQMLERVREHAEWLRSQATEIELAADNNFRIDVVIGTHVPRTVKVIQEGRK